LRLCASSERSERAFQKNKNNIGKNILICQKVFLYLLTTS
jgi:hypothetical protein